MDVDAFCVKVKVPALAACVKLPVCEIAPLAVIFKAPLPTVDVPKTSALPLVRETALLPLLLKETAPAKALLCVRLMLFAPALKLDVPPAVKTPVCEMAPLAITVKAPVPTVDVPNTNALPLVSETGLLPLLFKETAPAKALLCVRLMLFAPALKLEVPPAVKTPVCEMAPLAITVNAPVPTVDVPKMSALPFVSDTVLLPLLLKETAPVSALLCVSVMLFAPALKLDVPPTVRIPVCAMPAPAAVAIAVKFVPIVDAAKFKVLVLVMLVDVPLERLTTPVKLLAAPLVVKSIDPPAFNVVVPGTVIVPV